MEFLEAANFLGFDLKNNFGISANIKIAKNVLG